MNTIDTSAVYATYTPEQIATAYKLRKLGRSLGQIAEVTGIKLGSISYVLDNLRKYAGDSNRSMGATENYQEALKIIGDSELERPTAPATRSELNAETIVKIWELDQKPWGSRKIAEYLGWYGPGSSNKVYQIEKNIEFYLYADTYREIRCKQPIYKEARDIILNKYPQEGKKIGISLVHDKKLDKLIASPYLIFDDYSYNEEELFEQKLNKAVKKIRKEVNAVLREALELEKRDDSKKELLNLIQDGEYQGYYLSDVEEFLGKRIFEDQFLPWFADKVGGIYDGKYYIQKKDFDEFMQKEYRLYV